MKIIIAGAGEVGFHLAKLLSYESQEITLIDPNKHSLVYAESHLDIKVLNGDATSIRMLNEAKIKSAELFVTNISKYVKEKLITEESEQIIFGFILHVIKNERMKYEESIAENLIKNNKEYLQTWAIYTKIIENYKLYK